MTLDDQLDDQLEPLTAGDLLNRIGTEWARLNRTSPNQAWAYLQDELMKNMGLLVPHTTSLKDLISQGLDIKKALTDSGTTKDKHPVEVIAGFLNMTPAEVVPPGDDTSGDLLQ